MNLAAHDGSGVIGGIQRLLRCGNIGRLGRHGGDRALALVMHRLRHRFVDQAAQALDRLDRTRPIVLGLVDAYQRPDGGHGETRIVHDFKSLLGAIQHARFQEILGQFVLRIFTLGLRQVGARQQALVHADRALHFAAPAKQAAQREVQLGRLGIELGHLDESIDGAVGLLIEQEVQPSEVRIRQSAGLRQHLPDINTRGNPAQAKQQG